MDDRQRTTDDGNRKKTAHVRSQPAQTESQLNPYKVNFLKKETNLFLVKDDDA